MRQPAAERVTRKWTRAEADAVFRLENGARMSQPRFHALYKRTPEGFRAQLIGGVVYVMASPVSLLHSRPHARVVYWLGLYAEHTPGTEVLDNATDILGDKSEPEPDACLIVLPEYGGQTTVDKDDYMTGPPELIVEVANTTRAIDLGRKKRDYEQAGVRDYVVVLAGKRSVVWFTRTNGEFAEIAPGADGLFRARSFPGLWLDPRGLFADTSRLLAVAVEKGRDTPEHAAFVAALKGRRKAGTPAAKKPRRKPQ